MRGIFFDSVLCGASSLWGCNGGLLYLGRVPFLLLCRSRVFALFDVAAWIFLERRLLGDLLRWSDVDVFGCLVSNFCLIPFGFLCYWVCGDIARNKFHVLEEMGLGVLGAKFEVV